jgi:hypothetical protein
MDLVAAAIVCGTAARDVVDASASGGSRAVEGPASLRSMPVAAGAATRSGARRALFALGKLRECTCRGPD